MDNKWFQFAARFYKYNNVTLEEAVIYTNNKFKIPKYNIEILTQKIILSTLDLFLDSKLHKYWYNFPHRKREVINIQRILMKILYEHPVYKNKSTTDIGKLIRNKDHSTVLFHIQQCNDLLSSESIFLKLYKQIERNINIIIKNN